MIYWSVRFVDRSNVRTHWKKNNWHKVTDNWGKRKNRSSHAHKPKTANAQLKLAFLSVAVSHPDKWCQWDLDVKKIKVWFANWSVNRFMPFTAVFWRHWTVVNRPINRQQGSWLRSSWQWYGNRITAPSNRQVWLRCPALMAQNRSLLMCYRLPVWLCTIFWWRIETPASANSRFWVDFSCFPYSRSPPHSSKSYKNLHCHSIFSLKNMLLDPLSEIKLLKFNQRISHENYY